MTHHPLPITRRSLTQRSLTTQKPFLFWDVKNPARLSERAVVEAVLRHGDMDDFYQVRDTLGLRRVADIFQDMAKAPRGNLSPKTKHFWTLYFQRHAPRSP
jgi:hypothetical protein